MNSKDIIKYLKNSIDEKGHYCYSLPIETTKAIIKHIGEKDKEIERLNNIINELEKWLDEESEKTILSVGHLTCLMMCKNKLKELKESGNNE